MRRFEYFTIEELKHMKASITYGKLYDEICIELELKELKGNKEERLVTSDEDCADCLCRVCARNQNNDSYNHKTQEDGRTCECNCKIGDKLIETEDDCFEFLADEDM